MESGPHLWLIPLLPLAGALWNILGGKHRSERAVSLVATGSVALSFLLSVYAFLHLGSTAHVETYFPWIGAGDFQVDFNLYLDPLSSVMTLMVTGVGLLIHIYASGFLSGDGGFYRFFSCLNLLLFFMLLLVLAGNYLLVLVAWEGVGLCSCLLIGFHFRRPEAAGAGKKAFLVTRLGDLGFLLTLFLLYRSFHSLNFSEVFSAVASREVETGSFGSLTIICVLLMAAAMGKSALIPLHVWLPDATAGPAPASALIHSATMVAAGVYLLIRSAPLFLHVPEVMSVLAIIGGLSALLAGAIAIGQRDIQRVLAYSTISQAGIMVLAAGVAAFSAAIFHLLTHAFFQALLFLAAGSVIRSLGGERDIGKMGGLRHYLPKTYWTFLIASLALAGIFPLSGFFSGNQILWQAYGNPQGGIVFWLIGVVTAGLTSFYIFRLFFLIFHNEPRSLAPTPALIPSATMPAASGSSAHAPMAPRESPSIMTVPLILLAVLAAVGGWIGIPALLGGGDHWNHFFAPVFPVGSTVPQAAFTKILLTSISLLVSLCGLGLAGWIYLARRSSAKRAAERAVRRMGWFARAVAHQFYVDELYQFLFVRPLLAASRDLLWKAVDQWAIDGVVRLAARTTLSLGNAMRSMQSGNIASYAVWMLAGAILVIGFLVSF